MSDSESEPTAGAVRFGTDGTVEVFDGKEWGPYLPPEDSGAVTIFKGVADDSEPLTPRSGDPAQGRGL